MNESFHLINLGCDKNRVDSEVMSGLLCRAGFIYEEDPEKASVIIINTCGFIQEAVRESIDTILACAEYKKTGHCRALLAAGCMAQRYMNEIKKEIPEIDAVLGVGAYASLTGAVQGLLGRDLKPVFNNETNIYLSRLSGRLEDIPGHIAYVKIAEGCDNRCAYCTIPSIRGPYVSRPFEHILEECRRLTQAGARELVLVAQDTARYGTDLYKKPRLHELINKISQSEELTWLRLMYAYPEHITDELIREIADNPRVCKYMDMPVQHSEDAVIKRMGRRGSRGGLLGLIKKMRESVPGISVRTTIMAGFPGETEAEFSALCSFIKEVRFDRLGAFAYSREEGTPAARMREQIKAKEKRARREEIMRIQQEIHGENQQALIGKTINVMPDVLVSEEKGLYLYLGRGEGDAYEVDSIVHFTSEEALTLGKLAAVKITGADTYDVMGIVQKGIKE